MFYSRKILESHPLTWSLSDPEQGVSSSRMSCLYSQCRRQRPLGTAVSAAGGGGCRGAGAIPRGGPPPHGMGTAGPLLHLYLHVRVPLSPGQQEINHTVTSSCHVASQLSVLEILIVGSRGENVNTLLGVIVLSAFEKQPPFSPWGQRSTVFMPVCGMSGSCGWVAVPVCGC